MTESLVIAQIVISVLLVVAILLQKGEAGLGTVFGGSVTEGHKTRRGFEAFIFNATIFLSALFIANAIAIAIIAS